MFTGYASVNEIAGKHHRIFCFDDYAKSSEYSQFWSDLANGVSQIGEASRRTKSGEPLWLQAAYTPVRDAEGKVSRVVKIAADITDVKLPILAINNIIRELAQGNFTNSYKEQAVGYVQEMGDALNVAIENINGILKTIDNNAQQVTQAAVSLLDRSKDMKSNTEEMSSAISQMSQGAQDQAQKTDESSKLAEQVLQSAGEMESKSDIIYKAAEDGVKKCQDGLRTIENLVSNMTGISGSADQTSQSIKVLTERAEEIGRTLNVITDIAAQTNLLALNAAIEAARAGDAGRGFAVVAEEIRKLAEDSRKSAVDIEKIISDVQKDTQTASKAIDTMTHSVTEGTNATKSAESIFNDISTSSQKSLDLSKEIKESSNSQKESVDIGVKNIEQIVVVAEETAAGTEEIATSSLSLNSGMEEVAAASNQLSEIAEELKSRVSKFQLK